ncbi:HNH endonuclease [Serratia grimesii]|uniref:HNH endonuclease n=1 Tax=Serratia grimesii TaxID=82995 RepID=UPI00383BD522
MAIKIAMLSSKDAVLEAIKEYNNQGYDNFLKKNKIEKIRTHKVRYNKSLYDINGIATAACILQLGEPSEKIKFSANLETVIQAFKNLGFEVIETPHPLEKLEEGELYKRKYLHELYGGQEQGGISTPKEFPVIFIFTSESGETHGYKDSWPNDNHFSYTGEGQKGNMEFTKGNKSILDHKDDGKDILLFEYNKKRTGVKLIGLFECGSWNYTQCLDTAKEMRTGIVFNLFRVSSAQDVDNDTTTLEVNPKKETLEQLRAKAIESSVMIGQRKESDSKQFWFKRSEDVKKYVLQRANGICESCAQPAPFKKKNGEPYLEPHHTKRLADEGPDHPQWVGAICPTCHRRIHSGADGKALNQTLMVKLERKETNFK